jgi:hypothetical protein
MSSTLKCLSLCNHDTAKSDNVDVASYLAEFSDIQAHIKRKHPYYDNYYDAKDAIMKVMKRREDIGAGNIVRKGNRCVIHFRMKRDDESEYEAFVRLVDDIKRTKDVDLFIKIVCG